MNYQEALDWIHGKLKFGIKPGVKRMTWMLEQLGNPQENLKGVHVVGTNGKGSVVNNLQHIFSEAGYEVGTFISPYIMDFRERISLNGRMISKEDLLACVSLVKPVVERLPLETDLKSATEFEVITLIMFVYFGRLHPVDIAFIEAGLGGRDDSTNIFKALAIVCPSIGLDHQSILGQTYAEIAAHKADVLKGGEPLIFSVTDSSARQVFVAKAQEIQSSLYELGQDFFIEEVQTNLTFHSADYSLTNLKLAMPGRHQLGNAALAIQTALLLKADYPQINDKAIRKGLAQAFWLGRTELMADNLMIDGAHNNESIQALVNLLQKDYAGRTIHFLFAAINSKPITDMLDQLAKLGTVSVTSFDYPNSVALADYPSAYAKVADFKTWLNETYCRDSKNFYVITGSLYFISQVRQWLLKSGCN
ncbi:bifunctional folylpolyglutamate synthase/dihydrofolate synthase [Streptococcus dentapri]|uniref:Bifunctional folylpolyglutamate synthase/dihydrofolate synthase n=1 Tax=Streptococcus dentapri TaxID=573564 RepID=A0ABV8CZU3_9STRE